MKRLFLSCAALLALTASVSHADPGNGVDLTWNNCVIADTDAGDTQQPATNTNLVCTGTALSQKKLFGSFKVAQDIPDFFAMDIDIDLLDELAQPENTPNPSLASRTFWNWQAGGCNSAGVSLTDDKLSTSQCNAMATPWGDQGEASDAFITAYGVGFGGPNRARMLLSIARAASDPFPLVAGTNYFAFMLSVVTNTANRACVGCRDRVAIKWNSATLFRQNGPSTLIQGPDKSPSPGCGLFANASQSACDAVPTHNTTWGQLKAIYR